MRIDGLWLPDEAGTSYPALPGILAIAGREYPVEFLVDTGADQTVLGSDFTEVLQPFEQPAAKTYLLSAAGEVASFQSTVRLFLVDNTRRRITFNVDCAVFTDPTLASFHLLGRDVLDHFALICDREADRVTLIRPPHGYTISG